MGKLARENFAVLELFNRYHIDFFCKGGRSLKEALTESGTEEGSFLRELEAVRSREPKPYAVYIEKWPLDLLADYIQKTHHRYTDNALVEIKRLTENFLTTRKGISGNMAEFAASFERLAGGLATHMKKEELMLFPAVRRLVAVSMGAHSPAPGALDTIIENMIDEHDQQYQALRRIREVLDNYTLQEGNDQYNEIVRLMQELDRDLPLHIHLENNILFPEAVLLAKGFN